MARGVGASKGRFVGTVVFTWNVEVYLGKGTWAVPGRAEVPCPAILNSLPVSSEATLCALFVKMGPFCDSLCQLPPAQLCQERAWGDSAGGQGSACWSPGSDWAGVPQCRDPAVQSHHRHPVAVSSSWHPGLWVVLQ